LPGVELRLVEVMWRRWIGILAEHQDGSRLGLRAKIHYADKGVTGDTVTALLAFFWPRVEVEGDADVARRSGYRQALQVVAERLFAAGGAALQPVQVAPGILPGSKGCAEIVDYLFHRLHGILGRSCGTH